MLKVYLNWRLREKEEARSYSVSSWTCQSGAHKRNTGGKYSYVCVSKKEKSEMQKENPKPEPIPLSLSGQCKTVANGKSFRKNTCKRLI